MKFTIVFLIVFLASFGHGVAQSGSSQLFEELTDPNCEMLWSRLDALFTQLYNDPELKTVIEISGKRGDVRNNLYWESMVRIYLTKHQMPADKWDIVRTKLGDKITVRFWLTSPGAHSPELNAVDSSLEYSEDTKSFIFTNGDNYAVEVNVCLFVDELALLSQVFRANPRSRLNVVLIVRTEKQFQRRKTNVIRELVSDYEIPISRIRVFKKISIKPNPYGIEPDNEYWLLP